MKPEDVKVGKRYVHPSYPGTVYMGIGNALGDATELTEYDDKGLIIIEDEQFPHAVGVKVVYESWSQPFWDQFREQGGQEEVEQ